MAHLPTQPGGCLGAFTRIGELLATGAMIAIFGGVGALSGAAAGLMSGIPGVGATLLAMLLCAGAGLILGGLSGLLTTRRLNRNDAAARRHGQPANPWNEAVAFGALLLTGVLCGGSGALLAAGFFAGVISVGAGMLYGGGVALITAVVLWSQLQGSA